jgi:hypothetical protein
MAPQQVPPGMLLAHTGHHESMKVQLLAVNWSLTPFALICVLLRLWTRSRMSGEQKLGWDDALIAAAMVSVSGEEKKGVGNLDQSRADGV